MPYVDRFFEDVFEKAPLPVLQMMFHGAVTGTFRQWNLGRLNVFRSYEWLYVTTPRKTRWLLSALAKHGLLTKKTWVRLDDIVLRSMARSPDEPRTVVTFNPYYLAPSFLGCIGPAFAALLLQLAVKRVLATRDATVTSRLRNRRLFMGFYG